MSQAKHRGFCIASMTVYLFVFYLFVFQGKENTKYGMAFHLFVSPGERRR